MQNPSEVELNPRPFRRRIGAEARNGRFLRGLARVKELVTGGRLNGLIPPLCLAESSVALRSLVLGLVSVIALASLSACGGDPGPIYAQAFGFHCDRHTSVAARIACQKSNDPGGAQVSRYCYRTLGAPN